MSEWKKNYVTVDPLAINSPRTMNRFRPACLRSPSTSGASAFSLVELLVVMAIIGILAGLLVGLAPVAMQRARESRLKAELKAIEGYIEGYKYKYGVYPPDGLKLVNGTPERDAQGNLVIRPELNPLYYELSGVIVENPYSPGGRFVPIGEETSANAPKLSSDTVRTWFGRDGFVNAAGVDRKRSLFKAEFKESAAAEVFSSKSQGGYVDLRVLAVGWGGDAHRPSQQSGFAWPKGDKNFPAPIAENPRLNPWRYVSSNPTNNPGRFDLWAEYIESGKKKIVANWRQ